MKKSILIYLTSLLTLSLFSQDFKANLKEIRDNNQHCLDKGKFMYNCSSKFYIQADSLLNVVYRYIRKDMDLSEKDNLKKEQLIWLKERNKKFKQIDNQNTGLGKGGLDDLMVKKDKKAEIVNNRTTYLIEKFIHGKKSNTISFEKISESLDENYLSLICKTLNIEQGDIEKQKSSSLKYDNENLFYVITYKSEKNTEYGNYFETSFILIDTKLKRIVRTLKYDEVSYYDEEVGQPGRVEISSKLIDLGLENNTIALKYKRSMGGCANAYNSDNLILILPKKDSFSEILKPFHLNRTIYEGSCNGNYSMEKQKSNIEIIKNQENKYDLRISTNIKYEVEKGSGLDDEEKIQYEKVKSIIRNIKPNGENKYEISELPYYFFSN